MDKTTERSGSLRVMHVVEASLGGVRRYVEGIAAVSTPDLFTNALAYSGVRADTQFLQLLEEVKTEGWATYDIPMQRDISPLSDYKAVRLLRRALKDFRPDVVHCHSSKAGAIGRLAIRATKKPRPAATYTPNAIAVRLGKRFEFAERILGRRMTDLIIAISDSEKEELAGTGVISPAKISVLWPFIDTEYFHPMDKEECRSALGLPQGRPLVVAIGRLTYQKDPVGFVEIMAKVRDEVPDVVAVWVGDGEMRPEIEQAIDRHDLRDVVTVAGWQTDVRPYLGASDLMLLTSVYESYGYVTAEALAMAVPVVATRVTGTVDLIPEERFGRLYESGDSSAGAKAVTELLLMPREESAALGIAGREFVHEMFSREAKLQRLLRVYDEGLAIRDGTSAGVGD